MIKDHPFADGNKRIGSLLFLEYLRRNGLLEYTTTDDLPQAALQNLRCGTWSQGNLQPEDVGPPTMQIGDPFSRQCLFQLVCTYFQSVTLRQSWSNRG